MFYEKILQEMNRSNIKYVVVGGIAVNLHGVPRATADLDLMIKMSASNLFNFLKIMKRLGFRSRPPVKPNEITLEKLEKWKREKGLRDLTFQSRRVPYEEVDILLECPIDFDEVYERIERIETKGPTIPLVSIEDLIKLKQHSKRLQDISDIQALKKVKEMKQR